MKLKNISLITLVTGILFSCTSDDIITPSPEINNDGTFSILLSTSDNILTTKAAGDDAANNYEYATDEELNVDDVIIAIFSTDDGALLSQPKRYSQPGKTTCTDPKDGKTKTAWEIKDTDIKVEQDIFILAIANTDINVDKYKDYNNFSYDDFKEITITNNTFNPSYLAKRGTTESMYLTKDQATPIIIPMQQLAVRLDLSVTVDIHLDPKELEFEYDPSFLKAINEIADKNANNIQGYKKRVTVSIPEIDPETNETVYHDYTFWSLQNSGDNSEGNGYYNANDSKGLDFYNPNKNGGIMDVSKDASTVKTIYITGVSLTRKIIYETWGYHLESITINNIQIETDLILSSNNDADFDPTNSTIEIGETVVLETFKIPTFYTYEKALYQEAQLEEALKINFKGTLTKGEATLTERYENQGIFAIWIDKFGNQGAWGNGDGNIFVPLMPKDASIVGDPIPDWDDEKIVETKDLNFEVAINPNGNGVVNKGLIHGNIYSFNIKIREAKENNGKTFRNTTLEVSESKIVEISTFSDLTITPW